MELSKDVENAITDAVAKAIACQMKLHSDIAEKKISENLDVFTARLDKINDKMERTEKTQAVVNNKLNIMDGFINNVWKENAGIRKEHEELLKKVKESQRKMEVAENKADDLEQYGRKTMLDINGFRRLADKVL